MSLLHPFLEVVRSPETSGPITATALSSIDKFITYSVLSPSSPNLAIAMSQLSSAGTHCKFEASDSVSDEVVLLKILDVLRNCLTGHLGQVLSDESVCEMMETGLSMCCQMRLSGASSSSSSLEPPHSGTADATRRIPRAEMLRRSAERTMQAMVAAVFSRLRHLSPEDDDLPATQSSSAAASVSGAAAADDGALGTNGPRMIAPDPRSAQIPAAGPGEAGEPGVGPHGEAEKVMGEGEGEKAGAAMDGEALEGEPILFPRRAGQSEAYADTRSAPTSRQTTSPTLRPSDSHRFRSSCACSSRCSTRTTSSTRTRCASWRSGC